MYIDYTLKVHVRIFAATNQIPEQLCLMPTVLFIPPLYMVLRIRICEGENKRSPPFFLFLVKNFSQPAVGCVIWNYSGYS